MKRLIAALLLVTACQAGPTAPSVPSTITLRSGDKGLVDLPAGRYRVTWSADCTAFRLEVAPTSGATIEIPAALPSGEAIVSLPGGPAYVNRGGSCAGDYVVTVGPAS